MKSVILLLVGCFLMLAASGQDTTKVMLKPDENTVYMDEAGNVISQEAFKGVLLSGRNDHSFEPLVEDGKLKAVKLKKISSAMQPGSKAKKFVAKDIHGKNWDSKSLKGKTVVINFWFTSCAPCIQEMPELNELKEKYKNDTNIVFLAITYEPRTSVETFLKKRKFEYNIIADANEIIQSYGVSGYPTNLVINKDGEIAFSSVSYAANTVAQVEAAIKGATVKSSEKTGAPQGKTISLNSNSDIRDEKGNKVEMMKAMELVNSQQYLLSEEKDKDGKTYILLKKK